MEFCRILNAKNAFTTTYNTQTNFKSERFNQTILGSLRSCIEDHPRDRDLCTPALTYDNNSQPQSSNSISSFELVLWWVPGLISTMLRNQASLARYISIGIGKMALERYYWYTRKFQGCARTLQANDHQTSSSVKTSKYPRWSGLPPRRQRKGKGNQTQTRSDRWRSLPRHESRK